MRTRQLLLLMSLFPVFGLAVGCSSSRSTIEIRARASISEPEGIEGIRLWLDSSEYTSEDFVDDSDGLLEIFAEVPNSGDLLIAIELTQDGAVVAQGSFSLPMADNFQWGLDLFRRADDPQVGCCGCFGVRSFSIAEEAQNEPGEAIWITWGGQARGSDIVF